MCCCWVMMVSGFSSRSMDQNSDSTVPYSLLWIYIVAKFEPVHDTGIVYSQNFLCTVLWQSKHDKIIKFQTQSFKAANSRVQKVKAANSKVQKVKAANSRVQKVKAANSRVQKVKAANSRVQKVKAANSRGQKYRGQIYLCAYNYNY